MNVEAEIVAHLNSKGFKAYADVPKPRPQEFVTVERTGGTSDVLDRPTVAVQAWSTSRHKASELMLAVDDCMMGIVERPSITRCKRNSLYNYPDAEQPRYQAVYDLVTYR